MRLCALGHKGKINKESCLKSYLIAWSVNKVCSWSLNKVCSGTLSPEVQLLTLLHTTFERKEPF